MIQHIATPQKLSSERNMARKGLVQVYAGLGKGKTTAALGLALRATGHGLKAIMIEFERRDFQYGEHFLVSNNQPFEIVQLNGGNSTGQSHDGLYLAVQEAFAHAERVLRRGSHDVVILDDIFNAIDMELLNVEHVMRLIRIKPPWLELVLTGRSAPREVQKQADLVTQMLLIKHPFSEGIAPRQGIDY